MKVPEITDVILDSFIVPATPFDELRIRYDDGSWDKNNFASVHILFPVRDGEYDYVEKLFAR